MKTENHVKLSAVRQIDPAKLNHNDYNEQVFNPLEGRDYDNLRKDIIERGVVVPLIARKDMTLLSGHNRLSIALDIGLKKVPVQIIEEEMDTEKEKQFMIKENLFRRHLTLGQRRILYAMIFEDFESRVLMTGRHSYPAAVLAKETGIPLNQVRSDIQTIKNNAKRANRTIEQRELDNQIVRINNVMRKVKNYIILERDSANEIIDTIEKHLKDLKKYKKNHG